MSQPPSAQRNTPYPAEPRVGCAATAQEVARTRARPRRHHVGHRDVDALPFPGLELLRPRRADTHRGDRPRGEIGDRHAGNRGLLAGAGRDRARERLIVDVVPRTRDVGTGLAVARDGAIDDRGIDRAHVVVAQTETGRDTGAPPLAEHVGARDEIERPCLPRVAAQVELDAALVPRDIAEQLRKGAHRITTGRFDLQHLRAQVDQHLRRVRHGAPDARVEHAHPVEEPARHASRNRCRSTNF